MLKLMRRVRSGSVRIVIDTNVLLSGLLWKGLPHNLLNQVRFGGIELVMSHVLFDELAEVIVRLNLPAFSSVLLSHINKFSANCMS